MYHYEVWTEDVINCITCTTNYFLKILGPVVIYDIDFLSRKRYFVFLSTFFRSWGLFFFCCCWFDWSCCSFGICDHQFENERTWSWLNGSQRVVKNVLFVNVQSRCYQWTIYITFLFWQFCYTHTITIRSKPNRKSYCPILLNDHQNAQSGQKNEKFKNKNIEAKQNRHNQSNEFIKYHQK